MRSYSKSSFYECNFFGVTLNFIRRFKQNWQCPDGRVFYESDQRFKPNHTLTQLFMPVLSGIEWCHGIIQMDCFQAIQANNPAKLIKNIIKICYIVIPGRKNMASIQ